MYFSNEQLLPPAGKTYEVICARCERPKWPYLSNPPSPGWICGWCAQTKKPKRRRGPTKPKAAKKQMPKVKVKRRVPKAGS